MTFFQPSDPLQQQLDSVLAQTWQTFPSLAQNQIALTWLVYDPPVIVNTGGALSPEEFWQHRPRGAVYRGVESIYPASVVKLFYLVAVQEWLEQSMVQPSDELIRATRDMIVDSSNDATSLVVDVLTGTTSGPALPEGPFITWQHQRNLVNRYFQSLQWPELKTVNLNQKTWGDGPYGRERLFLGETYENRNRLNTNAVARLLHSIIGGVSITPGRSQAMMSLLQRSLNPKDYRHNAENQIVGFLAQGLPQTATVWSKAGWTSKVRHDAAYIEVPNCAPYLLVAFTEGPDNSQNKAILPFISGQLLAALTPT
ncbi:MAG: serine hydrolase [Cyanobacteria bacterium P01_H01_bin.119]